MTVVARFKIMVLSSLLFIASNQKHSESLRQEKHMSESDVEVLLSASVATS